MAPAAVRGKATVRLRAALSGVQAGEFLVEAVSYASDSGIELLRNDRMIRASDPDCYRMCLNITSGERVEQAGNQAHHHLTLTGTGPHAPAQYNSASRCSSALRARYGKTHRR